MAETPNTFTTYSQEPIRPVKFKVTTPAETDPVTLEEAKLHLKVDTDADDALITQVISSATEYAEAFQKKAYVTRSISVFLDDVPVTGQEIILPLIPLVEPTAEDASSELAITIKQSDVDVVVDPSQYDVDYQDGKVKINSSWAPVYDAAKLPHYNAVVIDVVVGYGAAADVPAKVKQAILLIIGHLYEHRSDTGDGKSQSIPLGAERLLWQDRNF